MRTSIFLTFLLIVSFSLASCSKKDIKKQDSVKTNNDIELQYIVTGDILDKMDQTRDVRLQHSLKHASSIKYSTWLHRRLLNGDIDTLAFNQLMGIYTPDFKMDFSKLPVNASLRARSEYVVYLLQKDAYALNAKGVQFLTNAELEANSTSIELLKTDSGANEKKLTRLEIKSLSGNPILSFSLSGCCVDGHIQWFIQQLQKERYQVNCTNNC
jgi:hypothetical protein